jgi:hypothetical protein
MTWQQFVADYGQIITTVAFFAAIAFIILYTVLAAWWRSSLGRSIVALDAAVALTVAPSVLHFLFGVTSLQSETFAYFTLGAFTCIPLIIVWRGWMLWRLQVGSRKGPTALSAEAEKRAEEAL